MKLSENTSSCCAAEQPPYSVWRPRWDGASLQGAATSTPFWGTAQERELWLSEPLQLPLLMTLKSHFYSHS